MKCSAFKLALEDEQLRMRSPAIFLNAPEAPLLVICLTQKSPSRAHDQHLGYIHILGNKLKVHIFRHIVLLPLHFHNARTQVQKV